MCVYTCSCVYVHVWVGVWRSEVNGRFCFSGVVCLAFSPWDREPGVCWFLSPRNPPVSAVSALRSTRHSGFLRVCQRSTLMLVPKALCWLSHSLSPPFFMYVHKILNDCIFLENYSFNHQKVTLPYQISCHAFCPTLVCILFMFLCYQDPRESRWRMGYREQPGSDWLFPPPTHRFNASLQIYRTPKYPHVSL